MTPGTTLAITARRATGWAGTGGRGSTYGDRDLTRVLALSGALAGATDVETVADLAVAALQQVLAGRSCSLSLFDGPVVETLASNGHAQPLPGRHPVLPARLADWTELHHGWERERRRPLLLVEASFANFVSAAPEPPAGTTLVLLPLADGTAVRGCVAVERTGPPPRGEHLALATALVENVRVALDRVTGAAERAERQRHLDLLYRLPEELAGATDLPALVERLAPHVRAAAGAELIDVALSDPRATRMFGTPTPPAPLSALLRSWRRRGTDQPAAVGDLVVVPMRAGGEFVGVLRARPAGPLTQPDHDLLLAVATRLGCAVAHRVLQVELAERDEQLRLASAREQVLVRAVDAVRRHLSVADDTLASAPLPGVSVAAARGALGGAGAELRQSGQALGFLSARRRALPGALRALARDAAHAGFRPEVRVSGVPRPLPPADEEALHRAAAESLRHARDGRAATVVLHLSYGATEVTLTVRDDGTALASRSTAVPDLLVSVRAMARRLDELGGSLVVESAHPRGLRTSARLPRPAPAQAVQPARVQEELVGDV